MNIFRDIEALPVFRNAVVTTGSFDGVHRGHQRILKRISRLAAHYHGESVVITFDPHPRQVLSPSDDSLRLLSTTEEKLALLKRYGIDNVVILPFTIEFSQITPREYVERFLIDRFHPRCLVVGYNHRFGRNRQGNIRLLESYADQGAFDLVQIDKQEIDHIDVSSTKIRVALGQGDMRTGSTLLNHPYRISGQVVSGRRIGRSLGYPTANVSVSHPLKLIPAQGVYAALAHIDQLTFEAMLYIGTRPTFGKADSEVSIEVHLLGFSQDIYGEHMEIDIVDFIRPDMTLDDADALQEQIRRDEEAIRASLAAYVQRRDLPSVAVVILNHNGAGVLPQFLPSFNKVEHEGMEMILADNCSTDVSVAYVERHYPQIHIIRIPENKGYAGGYQYALANLDYDFYALVNSDVEVTPQWLSTVIAAMQADPTIAACQPKIRSHRQREYFEYAGACGGLMDALGYPFCAGRILHTVEQDAGQYDHMREIFWASGAALVVRGEVFHAAGGFDTSYFAHQEEIDLCWTLQRAGYRVVVAPDAVVYHLGGATLEYDQPGKVFLNFRNNLTTITKHMSLIWLLPVLLLRIILDMLACLHFIFRGKPANALAVLRAYAGYLMRLPDTISKRLRLRRRIEEMRIGPERVRWYPGSILFDYYFRARKTYAQFSNRNHVAAQRNQSPV